MLMDPGDMVRRGEVGGMYPFSRAAITKYYELDCLNNRNLLSQFWRPEVQY